MLYHSKNGSALAGGRTAAETGCPCATVARRRDSGSWLGCRHDNAAADGLSAGEGARSSRPWTGRRPRRPLPTSPHDYGRGLRQRLGRIGSESAAPTARWPSVSRWATWRPCSPLRDLWRPRSPRGTAAEVGPGDNAGVGLLLRAAGCESVELIDRFRSYRSPDQQRRIYQALADRHELPGPLDRGWTTRTCPVSSGVSVPSAEEYFAREAPDGGRRYDLIVSRAALEHLYDPLGALRSMAACLNPGGRMLHKIDFRDHGMFTPAHPELTFLRYPGPLYRQMTQHSGLPNRMLLHRYRSLAGELAGPLALDTTILVISLVGEG